MTSSSRASLGGRVVVVLGCLAVGLMAGGCRRETVSGWQGYIEGEFVYVSSPLAGRLEQLSVQRGARVPANGRLFVLERASELAAQKQAADQLRSAQSRLEDLKKGSRPTELAALAARLDQARAAAALSARELARQTDLFKTGAIAANDLDRARTARDRDAKAVEDLSSQLATANLGARPDAVSAASADVAAAAAAKERADWSVEQKAQAAPRAALVYDTLYREGEYVGAGLPVVALLPPEYIKVRFFVPEVEFGALRAGDHVRVTVDGRGAVGAHVTYLSPQPEYTPPVLYNRENRSKLVFMVEAWFDDPKIAADLHPGQPVDVAVEKPSA